MAGIAVVVGLGPLSWSAEVVEFAWPCPHLIAKWFARVKVPWSSQDGGYEPLGLAMIKIDGIVGLHFDMLLYRGILVVTLASGFRLARYPSPVLRG